MRRILLVTLAVFALAGCTAPAPSPGPAESVPEVSASPTAEPTAEPVALTNDDPRCKLWSQPLIMLQLILKDVKKDVEHFPPQALDATCRFEVAGGTATAKYPHTYEALWLDASADTFTQVTAAFQAAGATVTVQEIGGPGPTYGYVRVATVTSPDGTGEYSLREPNHDFTGYFIDFRWTRAVP